MSQKATMKSITIQGHAFDVTQPYAEGHMVTEAEAAALNQTRSEAIRNNMARVIKKAKEGLEEGAELSEAQVTALAADVAEYDAEYQFTLASVGGGRKSADPVDVEANRLARAAIVAKLKADGRKVGDVDKEVMAAAVAKVASSDSIRKSAEKAVKERNAAAESALEGLEL